ncbi:MAG: TonB family protein, partial [Gemmatimonadota bacterium]|nr:TonB family protein [Gemmatimonadota bacterium]
PTPPPSAARAVPPAAVAVPAAPAFPMPVIAPVAVPTHLPAVDPRALAIPRDWYVVRTGPASSSPGARAAAPSADGIHDLRSVDVAVEGEPGNPAPAYPEALRAARVEGWVDVQFVVDTAGRAEPGSIRVLSATHPLFADAVREALRRSRYRPAVAGGRRVRQLVEQRFEFALR